MMRLLILHLNLAELSTGSALSDTASTEEHSVQILYYHHDPPHPSPDAKNNEAVQFALLCTALYNLPTTIHGITRDEEISKDEFDPTQEVQLEDSKLIFVTLEENVDVHNNPQILCVAQVATSGTNTLAIRKSIQRSHRLFCLLRVGGIHVRLSTKGEEKERENQIRQYFGMDRLFEGLKSIRRLQEAIYRSPEKESELRLEREELLEKMAEFEKTLPIATLREDLKIHYDAYISDFQLASDKTGGAGRCIIECIPPPMATVERKQWSPGVPPPHVSYHLGQTLNRLLAEWQSLLAVSTFFEQQLVYHHDKDFALIEDTSNASLLMGYFALYDFKMRQQKQKLLQNDEASPPRRISQALVSFSDSMQVDDSGNDTSGQAIEHIGAFLGPPPLAMLSASDQLYTVPGPDEKPVWAPIVYFRGLRPNAQDDDQGREVAQAIFYNWGDFNFLFYVDPERILRPESGNASIEVRLDNTKELLGKISRSLTVVLTLNLGGGMLSSMHHSKEKENDASLRKEGLDIIFVDRLSSEMMIFGRADPRPKEAAISSTGFFKSFRPAALAVPGPVSSTDQGAAAWASEGLDCRHWLASQLSLETLSAVDDAMNSAYSWRQREMKRLRPGRTVDGTYEMLTNITHGWLYGFADGQHEIYLVLDSRVFVTLADAHIAIRKIRATLLPGSCID